MNNKGENMLRGTSPAKEPDGSSEMTSDDNEELASAGLTRLRGLRWLMWPRWPR
jgi:hypothetical protein